MSRNIRRFFTDKSGTTAIEYSLIAGGICIALATIVYSLGSSVSGLFTNISSSF